MDRQSIDRTGIISVKKYKNSRLQRPILATLQKLMVAYLVVWSISPPLSIDSIYRFIALGCAGGWLVIEMSKRKKFQKIHGLAIAFMLGVMAVALVESGGDFSKVLRPIAIYMLVIGFIMNYSYEDRWDEFKLLIPLVIVLFIVFNFITVRELGINHQLARRLAKNDPELYPLIRKGMGGYALVYGQVMMFPVMVGWTRNALKRNYFLFALGVAWTVSYFALVINAGYSIAMASTIVSVLILLFYNKRSIIPAIAITLVTVWLIVLVIGYADPVREFLLEFFDNTALAISNKIRDLYDYVQGGGMNESITSRIDAYSSSVETIFKYPVIGGLWNEGGGGHSTVLDGFAKYGLFGGWIYVRIYFHEALNYKRSADNPRDLRISNAFIIAMLMVLVLDSTSYEMIMVIMVIVPIMIRQLRKWRELEDSEPIKKLKYTLSHRAKENVSEKKGKEKENVSEKKGKEIEGTLDGQSDFG